MYQLYIGDNCHDCQLVTSFLEKSEFDVEIINIDHSEEQSPVQIFIFPALFYKNDLLAYGRDIVTYFEKKR